MKKLLITTIIFTIGLLVLGVITSAFGACLGCPDWPLCYGSVLPPETFTAKLEYYHRLLAAIVGIMSITIGILLYRTQKLLSIALIFLIVSQVLIGGLTVILKMPFIVSMAHTIFGILTYIALIMLFKGNYKFQNNLWFIIFLLILIYYIWDGVVEKTASQLACEDIFCLSSDLSNPKVLIQLIYKLIGISIIITSIISLKEFSIDKLAFVLLAISIFISNILIVKSLLSVSMVVLHYILLLSALTISLFKSIKTDSLETSKV
ncbi:MAG: hypothetical protein N2504_03905 [candidate division WOR-3 bacterium]|nr:hypothetical protein [candidate division WOR-3 bacterium]